MAEESAANFDWELPSAVGVDLNRNYSYQWRTRDDAPLCDYCSDPKLSERRILVGATIQQAKSIRGARAESELEVRPSNRLVDDPNRHFRAQLDYHNFAQLILYPGAMRLGTDDSNTLSRLAQQMSDAVFSVDRKRYRPEQAVALYTLTGSSIGLRLPGPITFPLHSSSRCGPTAATSAYPRAKTGG